MIIFTNGLLLTRSMWENLNNLHSYAIEIRISIDATTEEVYQSLRRGGTWNKLQSNLEFFGQLRRDKKIVKLMFSFVIQKDNYSFMPEFVRMAKKFNVDEVVFSELQKYGEYNQNDALYMEKAVHLKEHPDNEHFKSLLLHPILKDPIVSYHGCKL